jgi:hypothetical protein
MLRWHGGEAIGLFFLGVNEIEEEGENEDSGRHYLYVKFMACNRGGKA